MIQQTPLVLRTQHESLLTPLREHTYRLEQLRWQTAGAHRDPLRREPGGAAVGFRARRRRRRRRRGRRRRPYYPHEEGGGRVSEWQKRELHHDSGPPGRRLQTEDRNVLINWLATL